MTDNISYCFSNGFEFERTRDLIETWNEECGNQIPKEKIETILNKIYNKKNTNTPDSGNPPIDTSQFSPITTDEVIRT